MSEARAAMRCGKCHRLMVGSTAYDGACECGGLIERCEVYPYRPPNGTTGEIFMEAFCYRCKRDEEFQKKRDGGGCPIIITTMLYDADDKHYPPEWISDDACGLVNPRCTAFEPITD